MYIEQIKVSQCKTKS